MPKGADPLISRVQPLRPRGLRVLVHVERGEPFEVTLEALERTRLGVGDTLTASRRHHLFNADADVRVRDAALNLVAHRARTRAELRRRLRQKGFDAARIERCLGRLEERGLVDDAAVAVAFVRDRLRHRPRGRARLLAELRAKGVTAEAAGAAIDGVFDDQQVSDRTLGLEVAERWIDRQSLRTLEALASDAPSTERERARRRLRGYLTRRGFRGEALRDATAKAVERAREAIR